MRKINELNYFLCKDIVLIFLVALTFVSPIAFLLLCKNHQQAAEYADQVEEQVK